MKHGGSLVALGERVYALVGNNTNDFLAYDVLADGWSRLADMPFAAVGPERKAGRGACAATDGNDLYLMKGHNTQEFWRYDVAAVMFCYAAMLAILGWIGFTLHLGWAFYAGLAVAAGIMGVHYTWIRGRERMACFKAFLHNNWVGAAIFAGIVVDFLVSGRSFG